MQVLFVWHPSRKNADTVAEKAKEADRFYRDAPQETTWAWIVRHGAAAHGLLKALVSPVMLGGNRGNAMSETGGDVPQPKEIEMERPKMFDHMSIRVSDFARSRAFYETVLAPLGYSVQAEVIPDDETGEAHCGFGVSANDHPFWIGSTRPVSGPTHIAFLAPDRETVRAFHAAAVNFGAPDNGAPGLREIYHPSYYGAFVLDPDGNNIEAVCNSSEH